MVEPNYPSDTLKNLRDRCLGRNRYQTALRLRGPTGINALSLSAGGRYLACGGDDGIKIWDLPSGQPVQTPDHDVKVLGQISATKWMNTQDNNIPILLFGTGLGNMIAWKFDMAEDRFRDAWTKENLPAGAVEAISVNGKKIAVIYRRQMVIGFTYEEPGIRQDWMYHFDVTIPRSVAYCEGDVLVWGLEDGALHRLKGETGKPLDMKVFPERIGYATYRQVQGRLEHAIDILDDGCRIYKGSETKEAVRFCKVPRYKLFSVCKQILWIEDERILASGSDHGKLYLFDEQSSCIQTLRHGAKDDLVQNIACAKTSTHWLLASATTEGDNAIRIWKKAKFHEVSIWHYIRFAFILFIVIIVIYNVLGLLIDLAISLAGELGNGMAIAVNKGPIFVQYCGDVVRQCLRSAIDSTLDLTRDMREWVYRDVKGNRASKSMSYRKWIL